MKGRRKRAQKYSYRIISRPICWVSPFMFWGIWMLSESLKTPLSCHTCWDCHHVLKVPTLSSLCLLLSFTAYRVSLNVQWVIGLWHVRNRALIKAGHLCWEKDRFTTLFGKSLQAGTKGHREGNIHQTSEIKPYSCCIDLLKNYSSQVSTAQPNVQEEGRKFY